MNKQSAIIGIAGGKGGVGKSMLASSLALLFSKKHQIVAVDADVDAPNLHIWLGLGKSQALKSGSEPGSGLWDSMESISTNQRPVIDHEKCSLCGKCVDLCQFDALSIDADKVKVNTYFCEGCAACAAVCPQNAITMENVDNAELRVADLDYGFPIVSAQLTPGHTGSGKIVDVIKEKASEFDHDLMLIDAPAGIGCPVIAALRDVDFAVLVTEPTPSGISDLNRVLQVVEHFAIDYGVVINKWDINKDLSSEVENQFADRVLGKISYDKRIFTALSSLTPIMETNLPAAGEIGLIYEAVFTHSLDERPSST